MERLRRLRATDAIRALTDVSPNASGQAARGSFSRLQCSSASAYAFFPAGSRLPITRSSQANSTSFENK